MTIKDVEIAENIYGPDIATLKGRSTRKRPPTIVDDQIDIPDELVTAWNDLTLCIDNMFVQGQVFLTAIDTTIKYRSATHLHNQSTSELYAGLDHILRIYNKAGYVTIPKYPKQVTDIITLYQITQSWKSKTKGKTP